MLSVGDWRSKATDVCREIWATMLLMKNHISDGPVIYEEVSSWLMISMQLLRGTQQRFAQDGH